MVATLAKNGDFYFQTGEYLEQSDAKDFKKQFKEQIAIAEQCGFYFPPRNRPENAPQIQR